MFESFEESYSLDLHSLKLLQLNKCLQKIFHALILQIIFYYDKKIINMHVVSLQSLRVQRSLQRNHPLNLKWIMLV